MHNRYEIQPGTKPISSSDGGAAPRRENPRPHPRPLGAFHPNPGHSSRSFVQAVAPAHGCGQVRENPEGLLVVGGGFGKSSGWRGYSVQAGGTSDGQTRLSGSRPRHLFSMRTAAESRRRNRDRRVSSRARGEAPAARLRRSLSAWRSRSALCSPVSKRARWGVVMGKNLFQRFVGGSVR